MKNIATFISKTVASGTCPRQGCATKAGAAKSNAPATLTLTPLHRNQVRDHLLRLSAEDRRMRFAAHARDAAIESYVNSIEFSRGALFGIFSRDLKTARDLASRFQENFKQKFSSVGPEILAAGPIAV